LPPGLSLNGKTGAVTGTPRKPGKYTFMVTITDASRPLTTASPLSSGSATRKPPRGCPGGERAARDILITAALQAWARHAATAIRDLARDNVR